MDFLLSLVRFIAGLLPKLDGALAEDSRRESFAEDEHDHEPSETSDDEQEVVNPMPGGKETTNDGAES